MYKSSSYNIADDVYEELNTDGLKAFYFNRAMSELLEELADKYSREGGHPDTELKINPSANSEAHNVGDKISAPKGWYDAGDFGKYVVNSGISKVTGVVPEIGRAHV